MPYPTDWMPAPDVRAFTSKKKARKFARNEFGVDFKPWSAQGVTTTLENGKKTACIVCVTGVDGAGRRAALLAHECVHVAKSWADAMGDESPSEEWLAYAVQSAYLTCLDQIGEEWLR